MAYKLKRIGKKAYKFEYSLVLHSLTLDLNRAKFSPYQVSVAFSRRGKRLYSKLVKWEPSINNPSHGHVVWPEPEKLTSVVTLYKGQKDKTYENKEWEVSIVEVNRDGNKKCLGKKAINMSDFIGDVLGYSQDLKLRLTPSGRKIKLLSLDCSLHSRFVRAGMSTDSDMHSVTSQMSVSALSSISDTEDLDMADLADLDSELNDSFGKSYEPEIIQPSLYAPPSYIKHEDLLAWSQKCVQGYHGVTIHNFTTSWRNGLAFAAIIHHHRPDMLDFESLDPLDVTRNNKKAFEAAHSLGAPRLIRPEQMDQWLVPDRLLVTSLIYQLYIRLEALENIPTDSEPSRPHTQSSEPSPPPAPKEKLRRTLPTTPAPKPAPNITPETQKRVREFLSGLDHTSPTREKREPFSEYQQDRRRKVNELSKPSKAAKQHSPFFGRKAERKMRSAERERQAQPFIPREVGKDAIEVTESIDIDIDSEFDSKDLFENTLLNKADRELTPKLAKKQSEKELGSIGKMKPRDSLLGIINDPAILQEAKLNKKRSKKNLLTHNPLYSTQEPEGFSSSDTSVAESGTTAVPVKPALTATACSKLKDTFCKKDCSATRDKRAKELVPNRSKTSLPSDSSCKTAVKKLAHIKSRREKRLRRVPPKEYEQQHSILLKKYASVPHMDEMSSDDQFQSSDGARSDADSPKFAHIPLQIQRSVSYTQGDNTSENSEDSEQCSAYSHLLSTQISAPVELTASDTHSHRLLDAYDARIGQQLVQNRHQEPRHKNGGRRAVLSAYVLADSTNGIGEEFGEIRRKSDTMDETSFTEQNRNSLFAEETDYIAHMQRKLCSMQISIETRQAELKEKIRNTASSNGDNLENQLMEKLVQLVQQKAQLDNRYDDLMAITEERDPSKKQEMLCRELKHKRQIDRSIKSREQLWEEEVLEKEINELAREIREKQAQHISPNHHLNQSQHISPIHTVQQAKQLSPIHTVQQAKQVSPIHTVQQDQASRTVEVVPPPAAKQTSNKGNNWRDRLLNVLA